MNRTPQEPVLSSQMQSTSETNRRSCRPVVDTSHSILGTEASRNCLNLTPRAQNLKPSPPAGLQSDKFDQNYSGGVFARLASDSDALLPAHVASC